MFNSIKYRFITIYFLLVLLVMSIVGTFIINRLETQQINNVAENMSQTLDSINRTSTYMTNKNWQEQNSEISNTLTEWKLSPDESIYAISGSKSPEIIASTTNRDELIKGTNALSYKILNSELVLSALNGETTDAIVVNNNSEQREKHIAMPIFSSDGDVRGILYMTHNLSNVYKVINDAKIILTYATILALIITTVLGYFIASSITEPIRDVTKTASEMAKGNFDQKVEVKSKDEIGNLASMFNFLTEELKVTINQMDLEKSKLNTIFNYMAEGVIAIDRDGYLIHVNPIARKILKLDENALFKKQDLGDLKIYNLNYYDTSSLQGESQVEIDDNFYKVKYAPFKRENMENSGIIVVLQDITKEHKLDMMRKEFVANVSHELKTPITTIKTYTETLLDSPVDEEQTRYFLNVIDRENNRMARLVSDLLQLSNMDYNNYNFDLQEVDTYDIINQTLDGLAVLIKEKNHNIILDVPVDIKNIIADRHSLEQILMNIVSNAVKYTDYSGEIKISASSNYFNVNIVVEDNGIGIPQEDLNRIFERFYRVEKGRSRAMGGTGLGLSIAKQTTKEMGGDIKIESNFGKGTKVTLTFKAA